MFYESIGKFFRPTHLKKLLQALECDYIPSERLHAFSMSSLFKAIKLNLLQLA